jgi:type IV pilus assembly protein PilO
MDPAPRYRRSWTTGIGAVLVAIVTLFSFWKYYVTATTVDIQQRQSRLSDLRSRMAQAVATTGQIQQLRVLVIDLERSVESFESAMPARTDLTDILDAVETLAARSNLTVRRFTPQPLKGQSSYVELPYKLQVEGRYRDLATFFQGIGEVTPIVTVRDLTIAAKAPRQEQGVLTAECVLSTFVMQDAHPPASVGPISARPAPAATLDETRVAGAARDPFVIPASPIGTDSITERRTGLPGLFVDDVAVKGIIRDSTGFHAMLEAPDKRTYIARAGEKLLDGTVKIVTADAIVFSRTAAEGVPADGEQDVIKRLRPAERGR